MTVDINKIGDSIGFGRTVNDTETGQAIFAWKTIAKSNIYIKNEELETLVDSVGWADCIEQEESNG